MDNLFHNQGFDVWDKSVKVEENLYYWNRQPLILQKQTLLKTTKPKVVELFSGCGGTSLGFELAGFDISLGLDIHQPSVETFKKSHPNATTILGDIRNVAPNKIADILNGESLDVLIGGIPCQGFSLNYRKRHEKTTEIFFIKNSLNLSKF